MQFRLSRLVFLIGAALIAAVSNAQHREINPADADRETTEAVARLIDDLNSDSFATRERAMERLIRIGAPAIPRLEKAQLSTSREVRDRSRMALSMIQQLDFQSRLEGFLADDGAENDYGFPGWHRYRQLGGDRVGTRELFAKIQTAEPDLVKAVEQANALAREMLHDRCQQLRYSTQLFNTSHSAEQVAAVLFAATHPTLQLDQRTCEAIFALCMQPEFYAATKRGPSKDVLTSLLAAWLVREDTGPPHEVFRLAMQYDARVVLMRARDVVEDSEAAIDDRWYAILAIAKFGDADDMRLLEPLLEDDTLCTRYLQSGKQYLVEIRDIALAALIRLADEDYGRFSYYRLQNGEPYVFTLETLGFSAEEDRQLAIKKWREFRK